MFIKLILADDYEADSIAINPISDEDEGTERLGKLPKDAQLIHGGARGWIYIYS